MIAVLPPLTTIPAVLCRSAVAFDALADEVEVFQRNSRQANFFSGNIRKRHPETDKE
jgi:hypothetical protein